MKSPEEWWNEIAKDETLRKWDALVLAIKAFAAELQNRIVKNGGCGRVLEDGSAPSCQNIIETTKREWCGK